MNGTIRLIGVVIDISPSQESQNLAEDPNGILIPTTDTYKFMSLKWSLPHHYIGKSKIVEEGDMGCRDFPIKSALRKVNWTRHIQSQAIVTHRHMKSKILNHQQKR